MPKEAEYDIQKEIDETASEALSHVSMLGTVSMAGSGAISVVDSIIDLVYDNLGSEVASSFAASNVQSTLLPLATDASELRGFVAATAAGSGALSVVDSVADFIAANLAGGQRTIFGDLSGAAVLCSDADSWTEIYKAALDSDVLLKAITMSYATLAGSEVGSCAYRVLYDSTKVFPFGGEAAWTQNEEAIFDEMIRLESGDSLVVEASIAGAAATGASLALVSLKKIDLFSG